jgi:hypothetical protein
VPAGYFEPSNSSADMRSDVVERPIDGTIPVKHKRFEPDLGGGRAGQGAAQL